MPATLPTTGPCGNADSSCGVWLVGVIRKVGLPTKSMVGARGADAAMLIAQHNEWLIPQVLDVAKKAPPGDVSPSMIALMDDPARVHRGERQLYATQLDSTPDGPFAFDPIEDVEHLAERRAAVGMMPLVPDYVCWLEQSGLLRGPLVASEDSEVTRGGPSLY